MFAKAATAQMSEVLRISSVMWNPSTDGRPTELGVWSALVPQGPGLPKTHFWEPVGARPGRFWTFCGGVPADPSLVHPAWNPKVRPVANGPREHSFVRLILVPGISTQKSRTGAEHALLCCRPLTVGVGTPMSTFSQWYRQKRPPCLLTPAFWPLPFALVAFVYNVVLLRPAPLGGYAEANRGGMRRHFSALGSHRAAPSCLVVPALVASSLSSPTGSP